MTRYEITTPEPRWTGEVAGVAFAHGRAEVPDSTPARVLSYFRRKGYGVTPIEPESPTVAHEPASESAEADKKPTGRRGGTTSKETP